MVTYHYVYQYLEYFANIGPNWSNSHFSGGLLRQEMRKTSEVVFTLQANVEIKQDKTGYGPCTNVQTNHSKLIEGV